MQLQIRARIKKLKERIPFKKKVIEEPQGDWATKPLVASKKRRKIHVPGLRKVKRILGSLLLLLNLLMAVFSVNMINVLMTGFFFANTFIFFDYLWKTRKHPNLEDWLR